MSKRMKALIAVMVAVLVLTVGGTAMVMAQEDEPPTTPEANGILSRVAEILGIPQEDLSNAFKQAKQDIKQEAFVRFLNKAVEEGRISQEEADEILQWWEERPEVVERLLLRALGFPSSGGRQMLQQGIMSMRGGPMGKGQRGQRQFSLPGQAQPGLPPWAGSSQRSGQRGWNPMEPPWLSE